MAIIYIPTSLREFTQGQSKIHLPLEGTITELLAALDSAYPGISTRVYNTQGHINPYISIFVNSQSIRDLQAGATSVKERDEVHIIPAIAGG